MRVLYLSSVAVFMDRVLVTGGAGFIGSHLCARLVAEGHMVYCWDNMETGSESNLAAIMSSPRFELVRHDIITPRDLAVDRIYNLACPASPVHYQRDPIHTIMTSTVGVMNMLELAERYGATLLQASTSEIYGDPKVHPQKEDYWGHVNPIGPRACYDESKRLAETLLVAHERQRGTNVRIARIFNTYGPHMSADDGRVVSNFIVNALRGDDITINGDGSQTRSFCYVSDMVDGLVRLMHSNLRGPVNLGNQVETSIMELAERINALAGGRSALVHRPMPIDDPYRRNPDITLARQRLGWEPRVSLDEGLRATLKYFRSMMGT
ncbi:MAG TPA: SDR family oxidoreductase [Methanomassiliicoccaceae archaeon]|nr:SDR family oxidoreductase [Methanomassiliicoccaceae archaeon]